MEQVQSLDYAPYSMIANGRFKGGFITRFFGQPDNNVHALQLELSQRTYMNEPSPEYNETLAAEVKPKLQALVSSLIEFAQQPAQER